MLTRALQLGAVTESPVILTGQSLFLADALLLGGLSPPEFDALLGNSHALDCNSGAVLIRKGHTSRTLYVLLTGSLEVWDEGRKITEVTEHAAVLGEVAFLSGSPRISDVKAARRAPACWR